MNKNSSRGQIPRDHYNKSQSIAHFLDYKVSSTDYNGVLSILRSKWAKKGLSRPFFVVTAYSESLLERDKNRDFGKALEAADIVTADGIAVAAAREYLKTGNKGPWGNITDGIQIGKNIWQGKYNREVVRGVKLMEMILEEMGQKGGKIFLLGGWAGVGKKLKEKYKCEIETWEGPSDISAITDEENRQIIDKIRKFNPDAVFVSFGRFKQEIWINENLGKLKAGVVMGVGSAFDELLGEGKWAQKEPEWSRKHNLKWLWRVTVEPSHIRRAWNAVGKLGWRLYQEKKSLKSL